MNAVSIPQTQAEQDAAWADLETPCFLFDPRTVAEDLEGLRRELGTPVVVSVKANPVLDVLVRCNQDFGDGIEIASMGELNLTIGRMSVPRFINTPALDAGLIAAGLACKATLVVDNPHQLALVERALQTHAAQGKPVPGIVLRINAASLLGHGGAEADHFGMDVPTLRQEVARLSAAASVVKVIGLHVFAGSHSFARNAEALPDRLCELVAELRGQPAAQLELALIGAGLQGDWRARGIDFAAYRRRLRDLQGMVRVMHEAGRAVFARAGTFAVRVLALKELDGKPVVICDGGIAHCFALAQTEQFVKQWRAPRLVRTGAAPAGEDGPVRTYTVIGNSCNRADVIGRLASASVPAPGDILQFADCGAYHTYSPTTFLNLRPARRYIAS
jgi:diaminopimelate decarboxylase